MYPAYRPRDVLQEYAITFFAMLDEGYRLRHRHYHMLAQIRLLNLMSKEARDKFMEQLKWAAKDPGDILGSSRGANSMSEVKQFFRKL